MARTETVDVRREMRRCTSCARRFSNEAAFCPFDGTKLVADVFDPTSDPLIGAIVDGRYRVLEVVGEGGMGRVYRVQHVALERAFAMKVLRQDLARDVDLAERFIHEARATASVKHRNVVQITDFGTLPGDVPYFVMDLLVGRTLSRVLREPSTSMAQAIAILEQAALGLAAAHEQGVIHRDVKPDNMFVLDDPVQVRVVDFGAAKVVGASRITRAGMVFGTPHYMSPEQAAGRPVDHRADVYAMGVVLYETLAGRVPFEGDTYAGVLTQHMFVKPIPPGEVRPIPPMGRALEAIALRCLQKDPSQRFATMTELANALAAEAAKLAGSTAPAAVPTRLPTRRRALSWTVPLVALALVAVGAWWVLRRSGPVPSPVAPQAESSRLPVPSAPAPAISTPAAVSVLPALGSAARPEVAAEKASSQTSSVSMVSSTSPEAPAPSHVAPPPKPRPASRNASGLDDVGDPFTARP